MAIRSLLISLVVTGFLGYNLTVGLTDPNSFVKKMPEWTGIPFVILSSLLYLLATWWAVKGFSEHKVSAIISLLFCAFGLGIYGLAFVMEFGPETTPGQYDYTFNRLSASEKTLVEQIAQDAGVHMENAVFTEHWHIANPKRDKSTAFEVCVQKGHVTALNLSNHPVHNLGLLSQLPDLGDLYLKNCSLLDMSGLKSTKLDRLDVSNNQISDLKTLRDCPNIRWLFVANNPLKSTDDLAQFKQLVSNDLTGSLPPR